MKTAFVILLAAVLAAPAYAQEPARPLRSAATIDAALDSAHGPRGANTRAVLGTDVRANAQAVITTPNDDPWAKRHAIVLGTLAGFAGGFAIGVATCNFPTAEGDSCSDYTFPGNAKLLGGFWIGGFGAAIGAGVGAIIKTR